jgi:hypothetical protein
MGIFDAQSDLFTRYRAQLQFRDKIMGGTPRDPKLIEGWITARTGLVDNEKRNLLIRTLLESGVDVNEEMTFEQLEDASAKIAGLKETTGFKVDSKGLYIESRQIKAGLRESVNILFAGERVGPTKKGAKAYFVERVFVNPDHIYLDRMEPDGVDMVVGHVTGPQGPRSTLGYHEYVKDALVEFDVLVVHDCIQPEWWQKIWPHMQENALGALRSQGLGRFDIISWEQVSPLGHRNGTVKAAA